MLGQLLFVKAFKLFEPQINGIFFQIIEHKATLKTSTCFSLLLFLIPIFIALTWRLGHITSLNKKIASALFILIFIIIGIFERHQEVKIYFTNVVKPALLTNGKTTIIYPIDPINFVYYMFAGLIIGSILHFSYLNKERDIRLEAMQLTSAFVKAWLDQQHLCSSNFYHLLFKHDIKH